MTGLAKMSTRSPGTVFNKQMCLDAARFLFDAGTDFNGGSFFVRRVNGPNRAKVYNSIIERMRTAFSGRISDCKWEIMMSEATDPGAGW